MYNAFSYVYNSFSCVGVVFNYAETFSRYVYNVFCKYVPVLVMCRVRNDPKHIGHPPEKKISFLCTVINGY